MFVDLVIRPSRRKTGSTVLLRARECLHRRTGSPGRLLPRQARRDDASERGAPQRAGREGARARRTGERA